MHPKSKVLNDQLRGIARLAEIFIDLLDHDIRTVHLDMGGNHKYSIGHKGHAMITEAKGILYKMREGEFDELNNS